MSLNVVMFVPVVPTIENAPAPDLRSILNPVSFVELSIQDRLIWVADVKAPVKLVGTNGITVVLESPFESVLVEHEYIRAINNKKESVFSKV